MAIKKRRCIECEKEFWANGEGRCYPCSIKEFRRKRELLKHKNKPVV